MNWRLRRRQLLLSAAAAAMGGGRSWVQTLQSRAAALTGPGLLRSYEVSGSADFDRAHAACAYVYDNSVVGMALLVAGDVAGATRIGDALLRAQSADRYWTDGRLRNAYADGPAATSGTYKLPGWWDATQGRWLEDGYQAGTATGVIAWAMLCWLRLSAATGNVAYREAAGRAADWVERFVRGKRGFIGGYLGFEPTPQRLDWVSTEHNLDLAVAFTALGRPEPAAHAAAFVAEMWNASQGRFNSGLKPDGSVNDHSAVDANLWPLLTDHARPEWASALRWILTRHGLPAGAPASAVDGVDFNTDRDGIWLEGTAITALLLQRQGNTALSGRLLETLRQNTAPSGLIWACTSAQLTTGLSTGLDAKAPDFLYFRRPHIAPTAWAALAQSGKNPLADTDPSSE